MTDRDLPYLQHVLDACADISEFVAQGPAEVAKSKLVLNGVVSVAGCRRGGEAH